MRKLFSITLIIMMGFTNKSFAQFVTIPDTNFVIFLQQNYPTAMVGNQMDTTDASVLGATSLNCSNRNISNVSGIEFFDNLNSFNCSYNQITLINNIPFSVDSLLCYANSIISIGNLPPNLLFFDCSNNNLSSLPNLPQSIYILACGGNQLSTISNLPSNLYILNCADNLISTLPSLPFFLYSIDCSNNILTSLPLLNWNLKSLNCSSNSISTISTLPTGLLYLDVSNNLNINIASLPLNLENFNCNNVNLISVPILPNNLKNLSCSDNPSILLPTILPDSLRSLFSQGCQLTNLPALPSKLEFIWVWGNLLNSLPFLPNSLKTIDCSMNQITSLPNLPSGLVSLFCQNNLLTSISLPDSLSSLDCTYNNINCLPMFSQDSFLIFGAKDGNTINCIPKTFTVIFNTDSTENLPLCTSSASCTPYAQVSGNVHLDTSINCALDSLQNGNLLQNVKMTKWMNNAMVDQAYVSANNQYYFNAIVGDTVTIKMDTSSMPFYINCPSIGYRTVQITPLDSVKQHQDFSVKCKQTPDLNVQSIFGTFRNAQARTIKISAGDFSKFYNLNCANNIGGTVTTTITGPASFVGAASGALTPTNVTGNTLSYTIADFGVLDFTTAFGILVMADTFAPLNSSVCIKTIVNTVTDINHTNDTLEFCGLVNNSYDPNDKACFPNNTATPNTWLTYTVRFQNTGNDTAYNIIIRDTLDNNLDASSFTYLASSHNPQINLEGNATTFNFKNINLVDSFTNEPLSNGWLQYKVKTKATLQLNASIKNTAYIYFDFNDAIITNTTSNTYALGAPFGVGNIINNKNNFSLFPNPSTDYLSIKTTTAGTIKIMDLIGRVHQVLNVNAHKTQSITVKHLSKGVYIVQFIDERGNVTGKKFVKE
jgi:uncharacterized repeat protein (TIGR01451 family)